MTDDDFIDQFERCTLPFDQWTHRAHIRTAYIYLSRHGLEGGIERLRTGIKAYNAKNDVPESATTGYNETTTVAFARLIYAVMQAYAESHPAGDSQAFCDAHPELMSKHILRLFYSQARRLHPDAKTTFVEPDLAALPDVSD